MELLDLENIWKECDRKIADNNRINREILRKMLLNKPEKTINWMKIKSMLTLFSPLILLVWVAVTNYQFHITMWFYLGLVLFVPLYIVTYIWELKYYFKVRDIDLSDKTLNIKKKIAALEKYKIKLTQIRYMIMPIAVVGIFLIFFHTFRINTDFIILILLIITVAVASAYYRFKYSIRERFRILNKELEEIERMENE